jgi:transposase
VRNAYFALYDLRLRAKGRAPVSVSAANSGQEHDAAFEHEHGGYGTVTSRRRGEGATTARVFETYVEKVLVPSLEPGQIVVMDNLGAHRPKRIRELIEQQGCELLYLPAYSPDYNPIEEAFAKIKTLLRKAAARSKEALVEAIGAALSAVTAADAQGFFEHAGYRPLGQLL